jgi:hypothetical protein
MKRRQADAAQRVLRARAKTAGQHAYAVRRYRDETLAYTMQAQILEALADAFAEISKAAE